MSTPFDNIGSLLDDILNEDATEEATPETPTPEPEVEDEAVITDDDLVTEPELPETTEAGAPHHPSVDDIEAMIADAAGENVPEPEPDPEPEPEVTQSVTSTQMFTKGVGDEAIPMPTFTDEDVMEQIDIRNFGTLVTLRTARWHGKIKDRKASKNAANAVNADAAAFETHKFLLAGADERLKKVHKCIDAARTAHYAMTLPWSIVGINEQGKRAGPRLLPNTLFMEYTTAVANAQAEADAALQEFEQHYASDLQKAEKKLGDSFNQNEYPSVASIKEHFGLNWDFAPIPKGTDFDGLQGQQAQKLADALNKRTRTMLENAMQDAWSTLYETVSHAHDRLENSDKLFHYTLIDKLKDQSSMLKHLNATGDQRIEDVRLRVEKELTGYDVKDIRKDDALRKQLGRAAGEIVEQMKEFANEAE